MGQKMALLPGRKRKGSGQYFLTKLSGHHQVSVLKGSVHWLGARSQNPEWPNHGLDPLPLSYNNTLGLANDRATY